MSLEQPDIYFVLTQFRSSYPGGALLTELLQIHQDRYLVKATVQVDGVPLATGMASAAMLELAEDQARIRALGVLGIYPLPKISTDLRSSFPSQPNLAIASTGQDWALETSHDTEFDTSSPFQLTAPLPTISSSPEHNRQESNGGKPDLAPVQTSQEKSQRSAPKPKVKAGQTEASDHSQASGSKAGPYSFGATIREQPEDSVSAPTPEIKVNGPIDLSDTIAQTSIEVERLGWTPEQGKQYLKQAYGKESRQLLTPEELMSFLTYLKSQNPAP